MLNSRWWPVVSPTNKAQLNPNAAVHQGVCAKLIYFVNLFSVFSSVPTKMVLPILIKFDASLIGHSPCLCQRRNNQPKPCWRFWSVSLLTFMCSGKHGGVQGGGYVHINLHHLRRIYNIQLYKSSSLNGIPHFRDFPFTRAYIPSPCLWYNHPFWRFSTF